MLRPLAILLLLAPRLAAQADHWAFRGPVRPAVPAVERVDWPRNAIDAFVLARLEQHGLAPTPEADDATLVRRLAFDLTGLPATREELELYRSWPSDGAWERLVDHYLESPAFGERWASVWLDLARYADSAGYGSDPLRTIWRYRDWVIDAFNANLPFDRFTVLQLAGDLLPGAGVAERLPTAFHRNTKTNTEGGTDDEEFRVEAVRDRVDTTMVVWMGLTAGCAKCHDHKFEPISQREYYALCDFFNHTADADRADEAPVIETPTAEQAERLREIDGELARLRADLDGEPARLIGERARWEARWRAGLATFVRLQAMRTVASDGECPGQRVLGGVDLDRVTGVRLEVLPGEGASTGELRLDEVAIGVEPRQREAAVGRFVRLELAGEARILALAEVEVESGGRSIARSGTARQSSVAFGGEASRALDGVRSGDWAAGSVTHTATERDPWWELDLGREFPVDVVRVWNRTDGGLEGRLAGLEVVVLDARRREVWRSFAPEVADPALEIDLRRDPRWLRSVRASASGGVEGAGVEHAIDGEARPLRGWAVDASRAHTAVFELARAARLDPGDRLVVEVVQRASDARPRFRVSATAAQEPPIAVPDGVAIALALPPALRDADERAALAAVHRAFEPRLDDLRERVKELERQRAAIDVVTTPVLEELPEGARRTTRVLERGSFLSPGEAVTAGVPVAFPPLPADARRDRLALARWLVDPRNPLTARVHVNRLWARLFGEGIVRTEEDFGTQGALPTHPELLDWLAVEFVASGQDTKALLRLILTSATYRQSAAASPENRARDPDNRLLSRGPRQRLTAEMVRDQALALSGLLVRELGGPPVFPPQPDGLWQAAFNGQRTWQTATGKDRYRRAIYTFLRRSSPYPALTMFDAPTRETCTVRRVPTNTPLQALVTWNDPAFVECAQALARRIVAEGGASTGERVRWALRHCLLRDAVEREAGVLERLFVAERDRLAERPDTARELATEPLGPLREGVDVVEHAAWTVVANTLLNLDAVLCR